MPSRTARAPLQAQVRHHRRRLRGHDTTADSGPGSLRQAILDSNAATGGRTRSTSPSPARACRRSRPLSPLPAITTSVLIDGTSQPGYAGTPLIALERPVAGGRPDARSTVAGSAASPFAAWRVGVTFDPSATTERSDR